MWTNTINSSLNGCLVTNEYLNNSKFSVIHEWFIESARKYNIALDIKTNAEIPIVLGKGEEIEELQEMDFILFWDKDIRLGRYLEDRGFSLFNSATAIAISDDKSLTHMALERAGIPMPKTYLAPMTFANIGYTNLKFLDQAEALLGYPFVVKECFGSFGQQVYLVNNRTELVEITNKIGSKPMLFQEFIKSSRGKDLRLQVVGEQVVAAMYRYSDQGDFRANITAGGKMKPYTPTKEQEELAINCCKAIGLDFAGVDFLFGNNGETLVCEVNSNAHFKNIYECTGVNAADAILEHIIKKVGNKAKDRKQSKVSNSVKSLN